jgi:uncharacterized protein
VSQTVSVEQSTSSARGERPANSTPINPESSRSRVALYLSGCVLFALGVTAFVDAELGVDPLSVLVKGLHKHISWVNFTITEASIAALCVSIWAVWNRRRPPVMPFFTFLFCGFMIDVFTASSYRSGRNIASYLHLGPWPTMFLGVFACAYGSALIIMSGFGIRAMDLLAISAYEKKRVPFWLGKGVLEVLLLSSGWLLGGPVGWGTAAFLVMVGWLIQPIIWANRTYLSLPDYGLNREAQPEVALG